MSRPLYKIAAEIRKTWPNITVYARPYLAALQDLDSIRDNYMNDSARSIVLYFLSNAASWRGDDARRIKAELKEILK